MKLIKLDQWALIPGPLSDPPCDSLGLVDITEYPVDKIADAILGSPGFFLVNSYTPTWWDWFAGWEFEKRWIIVGMSVFEMEGDY